MNDLVSVRHVTIIADSLLDEIITRQLGKLGAKGYTVMDCRGCGEHQVVQDLAVISSRIRIDVVVQPAVAEAITAFLGSPQFAQRALMFFVGTVQVSPRDRF